MKSLLSFTCLLILLSSCGRFEISPQAEDFFHVQVASAQLPVLVRGNTASGKILLYVNGGPGLTSIDAAELDLFQWEGLESEVAVAYYDQRGTGNGQGNFDKSSITMAQYIADIDAILAVLDQQYDAPEIYLVGHSFGGLITARYLMESDHRDEVEGWVCIDGSLVLEVDTMWRYRRDWLAGIADEELNAGRDSAKWMQVQNWLAAHPIIENTEAKDEWREFVGNPGDGLIPEEPVNISVGSALGFLLGSPYNLFPAYFSSNWMVTVRTLYEEVEHSDLRNEVSRIQTPSLLIWGRYDDLVPPELGQDIFASLGTPASEKSLHVMEASGHSPFLNEVDSFREILMAFVR